MFNLKLNNVMKKCQFNGFLSLALLSAMSWSCKDDDEKTPDPPETKAIVLSAPANDQNYDLAETAEVTFKWDVTGTIAGGYVVLLSKNADLTAAQTIDAATATVSAPASVLELKLEALGVAKGEWQKLYWSVKPAAASEQVSLPTARTINLKRTPQIRYNIILKTPLANATHSSAPTEFTALTFSWNLIEEVAAYTLKVAKTEEGLATTAIVFDKANTDVHAIADAAAFDALLGQAGFTWNEAAPLWWTVVPTEATEAVNTFTRSLNAIRRAQPTIALATPANNTTGVDALSALNFTWTTIAEVPAYTVKFAATEAALATTTVKYDVNNAGQYAIADAAAFDGLLETLGYGFGQAADVWWTVVPTETNETVSTAHFKFSTTRPAPTIVLGGPDNNASVNAYTATFPVTFSWTKIPAVTAYTLKLSPTGDFTTSGAFVPFDAGNNASFDLDKTTCDGLLAQIATQLGGSFTGKVSFQWTVEPTAGAQQPSGIATQTRTLVAIGGESAFPYELNADGANGDNWTVTASSTNGANVAGNILLGVTSDNNAMISNFWESNGTMGDLNGSVILYIDMQKVKTIKQINEKIRFALGNSIIAVRTTEDAEWATVGTLTFDYNNYNQKNLVLDTPVEARYIRIWITSGWNGNGDWWNFYLSICRVWVYGSNNGE
jgi:hypothetical protein